MPNIQKKLIVANKKGLHARPAAMFVQIASKHDCQVTVIKDKEKVNGKSIMGLLTLGAMHNTLLTVIVDGADAEMVMTEIEVFLSKQEEEFNT
jgi:phosphocarrier protein HPr